MRGLDAEAERLWWAAQTIVLVALLVAGLASWWLSGLAMQPLLKAYRQQEQFSADAAHELRAPVANLLAVVEAHRRVAPEEQKAGNDMLAVVWGQGQRLNRLITDLLLLAQLEAPELAAALQACDITQIASDLIEETAEVATAAGVTVQLVTNNEAAIMVHGRERDLYRLVSNLLLNAVHYTPPGGTISVSLRRERHQVVLQVEDSGTGISTADQQRIFDRFFRSDPGRSRQRGGTGLGLSIVAAIVRRHHGQISVASKLGSGSAFTVKLPAAGSGSFRADPPLQAPTPAA
ncbi:GHKL domain-containing protein [Synechococcus sp. ATX 2A4]|uniref:sensor histidine kinase n=1 Tax=Synechococcus sp. ATX 2A4 TaxID=2823727 RepID=UPI0020CD9065|nr:HAMP domain-containing sensor histidine kinase [Synechococcus sp. ATX 2A4]MCP9884118.1 GHKL domain-containing protein [Synechococcus sp. ATX 2A4]